MSYRLRTTESGHSLPCKYKIGKELLLHFHPTLRTKGLPIPLVYSKMGCYLRSHLVLQVDVILALFQASYVGLL